MANDHLTQVVAATLRNRRIPWFREPLMDIPSRQKQWEQRGRGLPFDVLHIAEVNVLKPAPGSDDVLIHVKAVGFNQM